MTDDDCRIGPDHRYHPSRAKGRGKGRFGPESDVSRWEQEVDFDLVALRESDAIRPEHLPKTNLLTDTNP